MKITLVQAERTPRSNEIALLTAHKHFFAAGIGLAGLLGFVFATVTSNRSVERSAEALASTQIDPLRIMINSQDLPVAHYYDYALVFSFTASPADASSQSENDD
jgi:hypothetical protein